MVASLFRFVITPVDTVKSTLQVNGKKGLEEILEEGGGIGRLYRGGGGNAVASLVGKSGEEKRERSCGDYGMVNYSNSVEHISHQGTTLFS